VYKWDVSSFEACAAGVKKVGPDLARSKSSSTMPHHQDTAFHKMTLDQWNAVIKHQSRPRCST